MIYNGKEVEFPAVMQVSFFKVFETLEQLVKTADQSTSSYAKELLMEADLHPELREGISDMKQLKKLKRPIEKISRVLFPDALLTNEIKALTPPFYFEPIHTTTRFENIVKASGEPFAINMKDIDEDTFYLYCCYFILGSYYGFPVPGGGPLVMEIFNQDQQLMRSYKVLINADLCEFKPTEIAIDITPKDFEELVDNFGDMDIWKKKFPPNSWIMRGVNILNMVDVTQDNSIGSITSNLLVKSTDSFEKIQSGIRKLLNNSAIEIGVLTLDNGCLRTMNKDEVTSLLLDNGESLDCYTEMCEYTYGQLMTKKEPLVITDTSIFHDQVNGGLSGRIAASAFKSYMVVPLIHEEELLGFMELGAKERYALNKGTMGTLDQVLPILAMAHKRFMTEAQNLIEAIIQQECTTIHSSVKWRFEEEAERFMNSKMNNERPEFRDIVFSNLYPLYGQMDIKGSSTRRNEAVSADLIRQISGVQKVVKAAFKQAPMPIYEQMIHRLDSYRSELKKGLSAGSENKILTYLKTDVYPVFEYLEKDPKLNRLVKQYRALLDPDLKTVYLERKKYDKSVNLINQRLASYLDEKQNEAQKMFPHYYERYKTDGVEYNMYIGQSITRDKKFNEVYLRNLRLWQLIVMCEMEKEFLTMQSELETPVEIASLILVYNTPLSVHFRTDEKRFDVEGAYNARYEIIKKRVDKANIRGTSERITQPGKIAIIYSQEQDAQEYRTYLDFLGTKGYVKKGYEDVELEDLQGVTGLRALRVEVAFTKGLTVDEWMKSIEGVSKV
ncbi:MAG: GAF domain-containing protein [Cyclobacteriaceae bacterium]